MRSLPIWILLTLTACAAESGGHVDGGAADTRHEVSDECLSTAASCEGNVLVACVCGQSPTRTRCESGCSEGRCREDEVSEEIEHCRPSSDELDATPICGSQETATAIDPVVQWSWPGGDDEPNVIVTPLVANLNDDNADGSIDVCDIPDVVVIACRMVANGAPAHLYVLSGADGALVRRFETAVNATLTPALGDIDGDGIVEIVTADPMGHPIAFEHDGRVIWRGEEVYPHYDHATASLADLDNDGDAEISYGNLVLDHEGNELLRFGPFGPARSRQPRSVIADLDGDGDGEIVFGHTAYHHDGRLYYETDDVSVGDPTVFDFDGDGTPEVLVNGDRGFSLIEHDGETRYVHRAPYGEGASRTWRRTASVHDFDRDGVAEAIFSSADLLNSDSQLVVIDADGSVIWQVEVDDRSGASPPTAFDFDRDDTLEIVYADESEFYIFQDDVAAYRSSRPSRTGVEHPVIVDIDNDGAAEIIVVSNQHEGSAPAVQVFSDRHDRWPSTRRVWNQHDYHITNVREDGTIPQFEIPAWRWSFASRANLALDTTDGCRVPE